MNGAIKEPVERPGRPMKFKPGRRIVFKPDLLPDGTPATIIVTPEDTDGGQAARVEGATVSYLPVAQG